MVWRMGDPGAAVRCRRDLGGRCGNIIPRLRLREGESLLLFMIVVGYTGYNRFSQNRLDMNFICCKEFLLCFLSFSML